MPTLTGSVGRNASNIRSDVRIIQTLINRQIAKLTPLRPLVVDGVAGAFTIAAIEEYQKRALQLVPDGMVEPGRRTMRALLEAPPLTATLSKPYPFGSRQTEEPTTPWVQVAAQETNWLATARAEVGEKEVKGFQDNNPRILEYLRTVRTLTESVNPESNMKYADSDETAWCAAFVNWCLLQAGQPRGPSARAKDWMTYGDALDAPVPGAITVIYKKPSGKKKNGMTPSGYHVGFYIHHTTNSVTLLGGNQGDRVKEETFQGYTIKAFRWPR
jgi:uncharacterized protein (TIGR02594 family)